MKDIRQIGRHFISDGEFNRMLLDMLDWASAYTEGKEEVNPLVLAIHVLIPPGVRRRAGQGNHDRHRRKSGRKRRSAGCRLPGHRSLDGRGRVFDNIFVERLWRSVKHENVYVKGYQTVPALSAGLGDYFHQYNYERPH